MSVCCVSHLGRLFIRSGLAQNSHRSFGATLGEWSTAPNTLAGNTSCGQTRKSPSLSFARKKNTTRQIPRHSILIEIPRGDRKRVVVLHHPHIRAMRLTGSTILQESMYQCKADLLRLEVLWNEGGVYIDADMVWLHKDLQVSCHACEWVMSHIWMSHATHMNESCHTCCFSRIYRCPYDRRLFFGQVPLPCAHVWMCGMTRSSAYTTRRALLCLDLSPHEFVPWLVHPCESTRSHVWYHLLIWVTWCIRLCDVTHSPVWHDTECVRLGEGLGRHMCDMTHSHVCHDSSACVMTRSHAWHDLFTCVTWLMHTCQITE